MTHDCNQDAMAGSLHPIQPSRPKALDLFCCAGGAGMGISQAGFDVTGVDIEAQPEYPHRFVQGNALDADLSGYDFVWASPPCQCFTKYKNRRPKLAEKYKDLIVATREKLTDWGGYWIMENVVGAPLVNPVTLCGSMLDAIHCGDCMEVLSEMPDKSVDAIITDPPYGTTRNKWDVAMDIGAWWKEIRRICNGAVVMTSAQPFTTDMINGNRDWFRWADVWKKTQAVGFLNARRMPLRQHEDILVFGDGSVTYNPQTFEKPQEHRRKWYGATQPNCYGKHTPQKNCPDDVSYPRSVVEYANCQDDDHPTQKPLALMRYLVLTYTNPGDVVLDCYAGSGTTLVACKQTGRHYIGIEKETHYAETTKTRLAQEMCLGV